MPSGLVRLDGAAIFDGFRLNHSRLLTELSWRQSTVQTVLLSCKQLVTLDVLGAVDQVFINETSPA